MATAVKKSAKQAAPAEPADLGSMENSLAAIQYFSCYGRSLPGIAIKVTGLTPLLMNNPTSMQKGNKPPKGGTPGEQASPLVITDGNGRLAIPSFALRSAICEGGSFIKCPMVARKMMKSFFYETISILPDEWLVLTRNGEEILEGNYAIDGRRACMKTGGSVWRYRPKIELPWEFTAAVAWDSPFVSQGDQESILSALRGSVERAGPSIGLGDFRPEHKGIFGRFKATFI